jgi:Flp pilus assembly protein TadD
MEEFRNKTPDRNPKHKEIKQTMDSGRYKEALTMSLELQQTNPGDAYAWYYAGVCNYQLKNLGEAREQLQKAQLMSPMWEKEWTGPYLRAIEQQAGEIKN